MMADNNEKTTLLDGEDEPEEDNATIQPLPPNVLINNNPEQDIPIKLIILKRLIDKNPHQFKNFRG